MIKEKDTGLGDVSMLLGIRTFRKLCCCLILVRVRSSHLDALHLVRHVELCVGSGDEIGLDWARLGVRL